MKIKTSDLKEALNFLKMAVTTDKTKPFSTTLIELSTHNGSLYGYTYDQQNFLRMKICDAADQDFVVTISFDLLRGLVSSANDDEVELAISDKFVQFKASSLTCKLPRFDDAVIHPKTLSDYTQRTEMTDFLNYASLSVIRSVLNKSHHTYCYRNVCFKDYVMITDFESVILARKRLFSSDIFLPYNSIEIISSLEELNYDIKPTEIGSDLYIKSGDKTVYIITAKCADYQCKDFYDLFEKKEIGSAKFKKSDLAKGLSTASVLKMERVHLVFNSKGAFLCIKNHDFKYRLSDTPCVDSQYATNEDTLRKLLSLGDDIEIHYGMPTFVKVIGDNYEKVTSMAKIDQ